MKLRVLALVTFAAAACSHGAAPPAVEEPPMPESEPTDAAVDIAVTPDAPVGAAPDGDGARANRLIKGIITRSSNDYIEITFERSVAKGWTGDLWDEAQNRAVPGSAFVIMGVRGRLPDRTFGSTKLPRPLASYGDVTSVRVKERYE